MFAMFAAGNVTTTIFFCIRSPYDSRVESFSQVVADAGCGVAGFNAGNTLARKSTKLAHPRRRVVALQVNGVDVCRRRLKIRQHPRQTPAAQMTRRGPCDPHQNADAVVLH
jgi:hypothetical protein